MNKTLLMLLLLVSLLTAKTIHINVDSAYSSGEFFIETIDFTYIDNGSGTLNSGNDTIFFSNGTVLTFINSFGMHCGAGGFCLLDTVSRLNFKGEGEKEFENYEQNILKTKNKIHENWYLIDSVPESLFEADTFDVSSWKKPQKYQASYFYVMHGQDGGPANFYLADDYNCMNYIHTEKNTVVLELLEAGVWKGNDVEDGSIGHLTFRWAVDSAGNKKFKHVIRDTLQVQTHFHNDSVVNTSYFSPGEEIERITMYEYPGKGFHRISYKNNNMQFESFLCSNNDLETDTMAYRIETNMNSYTVYSLLNIEINDSFAKDDALELEILDHWIDPDEGVIITPHDTDYIASINVIKNDMVEKLDTFEVIYSPHHGRVSCDEDGYITYTLPKDSITVVWENDIERFDSLSYIVTCENGKVDMATLYFDAQLTPINVIQTTPSHTYSLQNIISDEIEVFTLNGRLLRSLKKKKLSVVHTLNLSAGFYIVSLKRGNVTHRQKLFIK